MKMNCIVIAFLTIMLSSCQNKCEVCEVLKDGQMIEEYESCDEEAKKVTKSICQEMAKLQDSECKCRKK